MPALERNGFYVRRKLGQGHFIDRPVPPSCGAARKVQSMMRYPLLAIVLVATFGCSSFSEWRYRGFTNIAKSFFTAAANKDDTKTAALVSDSLALERARIIVEAEPELLEQAARNIRAVRGTTRDGVAIIDFTLPYKGHEETISVAFRRRGTAWLVNSFMIPSRS
jgi:hypothetical protein